jgi:CHAT domain-containing protein
MEKQGDKAPEGEMKRLKEEYEAKEAEYERFIKEVKFKNAELASLISVSPTSAEAIQSLLDADTSLVEYYTTRDKTYAWVLAKNDIKVYEIPLNEEELKNKVDAFLLPNISNRSRKARPLITMAVGQENKKETPETEREGNRQRFYQEAVAFYQSIFAPLEKEIKTGKLIIVPHGVLHKVPFATLSDGSKYLIDRYALSVLPAASVMEYVVKKRKPEKDRLVTLANPQTDYLPLGFAEKEGQVLAAMFPQNETYYRAKATETLAKKKASEFNIIHFASHGEFNDRQPLQSGLLLAKDDENDGYLQVHEIFGLDLKNANLVTLSACETALSKIQGGDDLIGLSRGFIYAGSPSLLATLWKVDDASTAKLMELFYKNWRQGMSKPEALRQAQLTLKSMPQYWHPFFWAPFVMIGDWR